MRMMSVEFLTKKPSPFLIFSLIIHLGALLLGMLLWVEPLRLPPLPPEFDVEFVKVDRPETPPPPEPVKPPVKPPPEPVVQEQKPPPPKPAFDMDWTVAEAHPSFERGTVAAKPGEPSLSGDIARTPTAAPTARDHLQTEGIAPVDLPTFNGQSVPDPPAGASQIDMADGKELEADSPDVELDELKYWHDRGRAIAGTQMGNSSGGGGGGGGAAATGIPIHLDMMNQIGRDIAEVATTRKVDLVFVIDRTGSMRDNVRGIRAYVDAIFDRLSRAGHDTAVGLVAFGEVKISKLKPRGVTTDHSKFKNWLRKVKIEGGGDLAESGLDAIAAAQDKIRYRSGAQRFFVFASDGSFHDADYDGKSKHSLDSVIASLQLERIRVDVIGIDYLPVRQLALATGGTWRKIPGGKHGDYTPPITLTAKMLSEFGALNFKENSLNDEVVVRVPKNPRPKWISVTWKVLNPLGERCYGPFYDRLDAIGEEQAVVRLNPVIDTAEFRALKGTYTVIYRLENDLGGRSILRRNFDWTPLELAEGKAE